MGFYARVNFLEPEGLGNVIRPAGFKRLNLVIGFVQRAQENNGNGGKLRGRLYVFAYFIAVHFRHVDVQENQIRLALAPPPTRAAPVGRNVPDDLVPLTYLPGASG